MALAGHTHVVVVRQRGGQRGGAQAVAGPRRRVHHWQRHNTRHATAATALWPSSRSPSPAAQSACLRLDCAAAVARGNTTRNKTTNEQHELWGSFVNPLTTRVTRVSYCSPTEYRQSHNFDHCRLSMSTKTKKCPSIMTSPTARASICLG